MNRCSCPTWHFQGNHSARNWKPTRFAVHTLAGKNWIPALKWRNRRAEHNRQNKTRLKRSPKSFRRQSNLVGWLQTQNPGGAPEDDETAPEESQDEATAEEALSAEEHPTEKTIRNKNRNTVKTFFGIGTLFLILKNRQYNDGGQCSAKNSGQYVAWKMDKQVQARKGNQDCYGECDNSQNGVGL